ncbi:SRPBCC family protein [uncultured Enterovirga sp.]|uniref:SRPBCC family protein n=1 Tax=uncultured Enterovirga sp. TaxID=2026352 RepID=UPI0035CB7D04
MKRVYVSAVIDAPVAATWAVLRDFNALPRYNANLFSTSHIEDGLPSDQIGCIRNFRTKDGTGHIREQLLTLSDREHVCAYCILEATLPVRNYVSEMRLKEVTETNQTFGEWWATFEVDPKDEPEVMRAVTDTFRFAFQGAEAIARSGG